MGCVAQKRLFFKSSLIYTMICSIPFLINILIIILIIVIITKIMIALFVTSLQSSSSFTN